jgi:large subunit ribosomal protein L4
MKVAALRGALSDRARVGSLHLVESFVDGEKPSTKAALATLGKVTEATRVLVVLASEDEVNWLSLRNVPTVHLIEAGQLNTYDVLVNDVVVFTTAALDEFLGVPWVAGDTGAGVSDETTSGETEVTGEISEEDK